MLRSQWLRSQSIPRSEYNWSLKRIPCEKTGVDSIVVMCAKEEGSKCKRFHKIGRLIDASRVIEEPSNVIFLLVDTHEGVVKVTFLRTRISLMGCLPKEFGAELANSELAWHTGYVWDIIDNIFSMWDEFNVKGQKIKKMKKDLYSCSSSKSIPTLLPLPDDMSPSPWRCLQVPEAFKAHTERAKMERSRRVWLSSIDYDDSLHHYVWDTLHTMSYAIYNGDCEQLDTLVPRKEYSLVIIDISQGYNIKGCINDEEPFSYKQFKKVVEAFCKVTTSNMWRFIVFHLDAQQGMDGEQCPQMINFKDGVDYNSILSYNAVVKKLKHMDKDSHGEIVNPYQKPQSLINYLIDMFSNEGDWVLYLFSGSGTTIACILKKGRNCISVEKDLIQVNYINQRVNALRQLPDEFQEVCFKEGNIDSNKVVMCSMETQPPLGNLIGKEHYGELANIEDPLSRSIMVILDSIEEVVGSMHEIDPTPFDDEQGLLDYIDK
eukprot:Gb_17912 [translate_table: standard]